MAPRFKPVITAILSICYFNQWVARAIHKFGHFDYRQHVTWFPGPTLIVLQHALFDRKKLGWSLLFHVWQGGFDMSTTNLLRLVYQIVPWPGSAGSHNRVSCSLDWNNILHSCTLIWRRFSSWRLHTDRQTSIMIRRRLIIFCLRHTYQSWRLGVDLKNWFDRGLITNEC